MENTPLAPHLSIRDLQEGIPSTEESSSGLILTSGERIYRCRIAGVVVQQEIRGKITTLRVDDSTGTFLVRCFEELSILPRLVPGTCVLFLGKIRSYQQEMYLTPDIMKIISPLWLRVYSLQRQKKGTAVKPISLPLPPELSGDSQETLPFTKVVRLIQELDRGEGVPIEDIVDKSPLQETEQLLQKMMERGDIFQIHPGKVKVL